MRLMILLLLIVGKTACAQVTIDTSLLNNSLKSKAKLSWTVAGGLVRKSSFAEYKTLNLVKGNRTTIYNNKEKGIDFANGNLGIGKSVTSEEVQQFISTVIAENGDSIFITMNMVVIERSHKTVFRISKNENPEQKKQLVFCSRALIETEEGVDWLFASDTVHSENGIELRMKLTSNTGDSIAIHPAKGFKPGKKLWNISVPEGFVMEEQGKQVAAFQTLNSFTIWIRNGLPPTRQNVIAAAIITILSTYKDLPDNLNLD